MIRAKLFALALGSAVMLAPEVPVGDTRPSPAQVPVPATAIERLDPEVDALVPAAAHLEKIAGGFTWTEGPLWLPSGELLFAEITSNSIRRLRPGSSAGIVLQPSGYAGETPFTGPEPGSNGMALDTGGRLTIAGHGRRNVYRLEQSDLRQIDPHAHATVLADSYQGKLLNSPNDLAYRSDGSLYFTDPPYGLPTQRDDDPAKQLRVNGVYRIRDAVSRRPGTAPSHHSLQLVVRDLPRPNGIAFSPDERYLYVSNSEPRMLWMRYRVATDGSLAQAKVFFDAGPYARHGAPDGMKVDREGNIYSAGPGGVWIFSREGAHLGTLHVPEPVSNVAWGGPDRRMLYITASTSVYQISLGVPGAASKPATSDALAKQRRQR